MLSAKTVTRVLSITAMVGLVGYIALANTTPFDITTRYGEESKLVGALGPKNRVQAGNGTTLQTNDLVYFNSKMPFDYDTARVAVDFKNPSNQLVYLGYKDSDKWHYASTLLDAPVLNDLDWARSGSGPYLYQRTPTYSSPDDFLARAPTGSAVGTLAYDTAALNSKDPVIADYTPRTTPTSITTPLRGKVVAYVYLDKEPFDLSVTTRNLNWYEDPDPATITVQRQGDTVFETTIDDDGNETDNHIAGPPKTATIKNPGPGLPESGVYKVVIDQPGDSVVTNITTMLHRIVFAGPLYLANNTSVYGEIAPVTLPSAVVTDARDITVQTYHGSALQTVSGPRGDVVLQQPNKAYELALTPSDGLSPVIAPKSDVQINGVGSFAFSPDQFFSRSAYRLVEIEEPADLAHVDYVLTDYDSSKPIGSGWRRATVDYTLADAAITKSQLSWLLQAPGLKTNGRTVEYGSITMDLYKKGWWQR